jgi:2-phospho-L-lactate/phosphoenolpyruvate guanylyltransferase
VTWTVVVPVKRLTAAKTRLVGRADADRSRLALAFAQDTVSACGAATSVGRVVVVTDDPAVHAAVGDLPRVVLVPDPGGGLDEAVRAGAEGEAGPCAVVLGDHPALRPDELDEVLGRAAGHPRAVVADSAGSGTALLAARSGAGLRPRFGPGSFQRHRADGAVAVPVDEPSGLRRDVDGPEDLAAAVALGVGPATAAALGVRS